MFRNLGIRAASVKSLVLENVGPIRSANVEFGDLTVLVGPQATGKSIFLQFLKLVVDRGHVLAELKKYGLNWNKKVPKFLDAYLGEGMSGVWRESSRILKNDEEVILSKLVSRQLRDTEERLFYIPAQRVLALRTGWPRPFSDYDPGDPFAVRDYSEKLRAFLETEVFSQQLVFPQPRRIKSAIKTLLNTSLFNDFRLRIDSYRSQKRLVLDKGESEKSAELPFMVWSAGQREFVPLLLGLYWLLPPTKVPRRGVIKWVVIEELEMGLHPRAVSAVMLLVLELLWRGYSVCLSTHSPQVLESIWVLNQMKVHRAEPRRVLELFGVEGSGSLLEIAEAVLKKALSVYYFDPSGHSTINISGLNPGAEGAEARWGGLTEFSGKAADVVASIVNESGSRSE